jgi:8-oxo-dGTP diphosphatase
MKFNNRPNRCVQIEGEDCWLSRSTTVLGVLIVVKDGQGFVPLGQRGPGLPNEVGKWGLPGGYLDYDETIGEALRRETWEELGLDLEGMRSVHGFHGDLDNPYCIISVPKGQQQNLGMRFPLMFFLQDGADLPLLKPQVGPDEVTATQWMTLEDALVSNLAFRHEVAIQDCLSRYYGNSIEPRSGQLKSSSF